MWRIFLIRGETGAEKTSYGVRSEGLKKLEEERGGELEEGEEGGRIVVVFSPCMQSDPKTQVQPLCSPLLPLSITPNLPLSSTRAAKCLSI